MANPRPHSLLQQENSASSQSPVGIPSDHDANEDTDTALAQTQTQMNEAVRYILHGNYRLAILLLIRVLEQAKRFVDGEDGREPRLFGAAAGAPADDGSQLDRNLLRTMICHCSSTSFVDDAAAAAAAAADNPPDDVIAAMNNADNDCRNSSSSRPVATLDSLPEINIFPFPDIVGPGGTPLRYPIYLHDVRTDPSVLCLAAVYNLALAFHLQALLEAGALPIPSTPQRQSSDACEATLRPRSPGGSTARTSPTIIADNETTSSAVPLLDSYRSARCKMLLGRALGLYDIALSVPSRVASSFSIDACPVFWLTLINNKGHVHQLLQHKEQAGRCYHSSMVWGTYYLQDRPMAAIGQRRSVEDVVAQETMEFFLQNAIRVFTGCGGCAVAVAA